MVLILSHKRVESLNFTEQTDSFPNDPLRDFTGIFTVLDFIIPASHISIVFRLFKSDHRTDPVSSPHQYHVR